jgi:GNAT superfamily N-acetyltransferase
MPHEKLQEFLRTDYRNQMALVGVVRKDEHAMIVAVGRYAMDAATRAAEVAFVVRDAWQCKGIGSHLFGRLMEIARARGIVKFTADVLADNARMLSIFHRCAAAPLQSELRDGVYRLSFDLKG